MRVCTCMCRIHIIGRYNMAQPALALVFLIIKLYKINYKKIKKKPI